MALLEHDPTDTRALTQQRFERMTLAGGDKLPAVDMAGLPAGPSWPAFVQTVALLRFRHWFHPWLHKKYGDVYTVRLMPKGRPLVFFTRPEHAKEIFAGDPEVFHAGKGNAILGPVMGEHSLLLQDGGEHKRARKLLMPAFNGQALRSYQAMITDLARDEVAHWPRGAAVPLPRPDERAHPRDHPARRLRRHRRGAAGRAAPAGQRHRQRQPGRAPGVDAARPCTASGRGRRPSRTRSSSTS